MYNSSQALHDVYMTNAMNTHTVQLTYLQDDVAAGLVLRVAEATIGALCPVTEAVVLEVKPVVEGLSQRVSIALQFEAANDNEARRTVRVMRGAVQHLIQPGGFMILDGEAV